MTNILLAALPIIAALETKGIAAISAAIAISCGAIGQVQLLKQAQDSLRSSQSFRHCSLSLSYSWSQSESMRSL